MDLRFLLSITGLLFVVSSMFIPEIVYPVDLSEDTNGLWEIYMLIQQDQMSKDLLLVGITLFMTYLFIVSLPSRQEFNYLREELIKLKEIIDTEEKVQKDQQT